MFIGVYLDCKFMLYCYSWFVKVVGFDKECRDVLVWGEVGFGEVWDKEF